MPNNLLELLQRVYALLLGIENTDYEIDPEIRQDAIDLIPDVSKAIQHQPNPEDN